MRQREDKMAEKSYAHPERLVETTWVAERLRDPNLRIVEVDQNPATGYDEGHIPGATRLFWKEDLWDPLKRDFTPPERFAEVMGRVGIDRGTTVILHGDANRFASYAFWVFTYYGHPDVRLLNGGRICWVKEGRELTRETPQVTSRVYPRPKANPAIRALRDDVLAVLGRPGWTLVDARSEEEYRGERVGAPGGQNHGAERAGCIPGAIHVPWKKMVHEDETFKSPDELRALYEEKGVTADKEIIVYCRLGHRASFAWFALTCLLGYPKVRLYDGSWTEWGSIVGVPIEK
jgi:thiosulfate/3-mercaptopyruvate sulfurtransferase